MGRGVTLEPCAGDGDSVVLVLGCVKQKLRYAAQARDLYCSPLWRARRRYAEASGWPWFIMSARCGLLVPVCWGTGTGPGRPQITPVGSSRQFDGALVGS